MLRNCVNSILRRNHSDPSTPPPQVGKNWSYRFLDIHPQYHSKKQRSIDTKRLEWSDLGIIQTWLDRLKIMMNKYGIQPEDIWNMDETGFRIGQGKSENVITKSKEFNAFLPSSSSRISVTAVECISAAERVLVGALG